MTASSAVMPVFPISILLIFFGLAGSAAVSSLSQPSWARNSASQARKLAVSWSL